MKLSFIVLALASSLSLHAADSIPLYNATLTIGKEHHFLLLNQWGKSSSWLKLGDAFEGFTLKAYDNDAEALTLEHDGKSFRVVIMANATIAATAGPSTPATLADAEALLSKMRYDEMVKRAIERDKKALDSLAEKMATTLEPGEADKEEYVAYLKRVHDRLQSVTDANQMKIDITRAYSDAFSKEELNGLATFYSTPLGEALTAKEPVAQGQVNAKAQARLMAVLPEIQQMGREFWAAQQAKQEAAESAAKSASQTSKR